MPDGFHKGQPFRLYDWQLRYLSNFYLVRPEAQWDPANPVLAPAFVYRRGLMVGPQKLGKNPMIAAQVCLEGVGPALFAGWAATGEGYSCAEHGCRCGWEYPYDPGEPRGMSWPTPLIQITAFSEDSTENTYDALRPMIEQGPLADLVPKTGEEFIRLPGGGRIDTVTSSNRSRLGQRITHAAQDELGLWTHETKMDSLADTQYRNLAGMGGRASLTTNAWDPTQNSIAQREYESSAIDVYRQFDQPPKNLSYGNKEERRKIHRAVYLDALREKGGHVDLDSIDAEAADLIEKDRPQAERFYGNRIIAGSGKAFDLEQWEMLARPHACKPGARIVLGFDGSKTGDHTALIATCIVCGFQWPVGIWNPADHGGEIPRSLVDIAVDAAFHDWRVWRMYADPPYWKDEIVAWQGRYGDKVVVPWYTWRNRQMGFAVRNYATAVMSGALSHDGNQTFTKHVGNCHRRPLLERDDKGMNLWTVQKDRPDSPHKIDALVAAILSWEARSDAIASGVLKQSFRAFAA